MYGVPMPRNTSCPTTAGNSISVKEAGRRGGLALLHSRGRGHFSQIGKLGQQALRARYPDMAAAWGRTGGRPRKPGLSEGAGEGDE
jgi:hypothetical protein